MENMVKYTYQLFPRILIKLFNSNICWFVRLELIGGGFSSIMTHKLYYKGIRCLDDIWVSEDWNLLLWIDVHFKSNLALTEVGYWVTLTTQILAQWCYLLGEGPNIKLPNQWIGLYRDGDAYLTFVIRCLAACNSTYMHH